MTKEGYAANNAFQKLGQEIETSAANHCQLWSGLDGSNLAFCC